MATKMPRGWKTGHGGDVACQHRDVSCCPECAKRPEVVAVYGQHFIVSGKDRITVWGGIAQRTTAGVPSADLIAAAPDLYEALRTLVARVAHYAPQMAIEGDLAESFAALAKARGEAPRG